MQGLPHLRPFLWDHCTVPWEAKPKMETCRCLDYQGPGSHERNNFVIRGLRTPASNWGGLQAQLRPPRWHFHSHHTETDRRGSGVAHSSFPFSSSHHLPTVKQWPRPTSVLGFSGQFFPSERVGRGAALSILCIWFLQSVTRILVIILAFLYNLWHLFSLFWKMVTLLTDVLMMTRM